MMDAGREFGGDFGQTAEDFYDSNRPSRLQIKFIVLALFALALSAASVFRWFGETADYERYQYSYNVLDFSSPLDTTRYEPGYVFSEWIFKYLLHADFSFFLFCYLAVALLMKVILFCRMTSSPVLTGIVYALLLYPLHEYTQIRAAMGLSVAYFALFEMLRSRYLRAIVLFCVAVMFHYSAITIAMVSALFLWLWNRPRSAIVGLAVVSIVLAGWYGSIVDYFFDVAAPLVAANIMELSQQGDDVRVLSTYSVLIYASVLACGLFLRPLRRKKNSLLFLLSVIGIVLMIFLKDQPILGSRLRETLEMPILLLAFSGSLAGARLVPALLIGLTALGWNILVFLEMKF
jgi:hypothetical protein